MWAILLPFLCSMVKSYCWSLHNHQILLPNGRSTVWIISNAMWSVIILKDFYAEKLLELFYTPYYRQAFLFSNGVLFLILVVSPASTGYYSFSSILIFLMQDGSYIST